VRPAAPPRLAQVGPWAAMGGLAPAPLPRREAGGLQDVASDSVWMTSLDRLSLDDGACR